MIEEEGKNEKEKTKSKLVNLAPKIPKNYPNVRQKKGQWRTGRKAMGVFVGHINVQDNTVFFRKQKFIKTWRLENHTKMKWPKGCYLTVVGTFCDRMGAPEKIYIKDEDLPEPGFSIDIDVHFKAPEKPGYYMGYWRMCDPNGKMFGERLRVKIQVK